MSLVVLSIAKTKEHKQGMGGGVEYSSAKKKHTDTRLDKARRFMEIYIYADRFHRKEGHFKYISLYSFAVDPACLSLECPSFVAFVYTLYSHHHHPPHSTYKENSSCSLFVIRRAVKLQCHPSFMPWCLLQMYEGSCEICSQ